MADSTPPPATYPLALTEVEKVELASALSWHFGDYECREDLPEQFNIVCIAVERIVRRRAGVIQ